MVVDQVLLTLDYDIVHKNGDGVGGHKISLNFIQLCHHFCCGRRDEFSELHVKCQQE